MNIRQRPEHRCRGNPCERCGLPPEKHRLRKTKPKPKPKQYDTLRIDRYEDWHIFIKQLDVPKYIRRLTAEVIGTWGTIDQNICKEVAQFYTTCEHADWNIQKIKKLPWPSWFEYAEIPNAEFSNYNTITNTTINGMRKWQRTKDIDFLLAASRFYAKCKKFRWQIVDMQWPREKGSRVRKICKPAKIPEFAQGKFEHDNSHHPILTYGKWSIHTLIDRKHKRHVNYYLVTGSDTQEFDSLEDAKKFVARESDNEE
jgi:hypothetical protein